MTRQKVTIGTAWPTEPKKINLWPFTENIYLTLLQYLPCSVTIRIECYIKCLVRGIRVRKPWAYAASENEYGAVCEDLSRTEKKTNWEIISTYYHFPQFTRMNAGVRRYL